MLKKCYKDGAAARAAGRPPLALGPDGGGACGSGGDPAASEAAMLSLLEEEEALEERGWASRTPPPPSPDPQDPCHCWLYFGCSLQRLRVVEANLARDRSVRLTECE